MNISETLSRSRCFRGLDRNQLKEFLQVMELRPFQRNQALWRDGEHTSRLAFVTQGRVKLVRHRASGKDLIVNILRPGDLIEIGLLDEEEEPASVLGLAQGAVALIDREAFQSRLRTFPAVAMNLALDIAHHKNALMNRFEEISAGSVEARLAALFFRLAEEEGKEDDDEGVKLEIPLSRQDIADLVDTTIETAIRIMSRWNREKLVITQRDGFLIPDLDELEEHTE